ncbi:MAG: hypothetical protein EON58_01860 [Alphaproteobacteria bacterium]|nr:MAG: hypothetical protein EON58_01860 [Alphaproteobacteria bacterium]
MSPVTWVLEQRALQRLLRDTEIYSKRLSSRRNDMERYRADGRQPDFERASAEADALMASEPQESAYMPSRTSLLFWNAAVLAAILSLVVWLM